jgi:hypothetical protein
MEAVSYVPGFGAIVYVQRKDVEQKRPIIRSKNILKCCQERFEKYFGSILVLSILNAK